MKTVHVQTSKSNYSISTEGVYEFSFSGSFYQLHLAKGEYEIALYGASGGYTVTTKINPPGNGGYTKGNLRLSKPTDFFLYIGGSGGNSSNNDVFGIGGFNGGANGGQSFVQLDCASGGSGGSTDLRIISGASVESLSSRIMVAGGGGSAACWKYGGIGGDGGGINGTTGGDSLLSPYNSLKTVFPGGKGGSQNQGFGLLHGSPGGPGLAGSEASGAGGGGYWGGYPGVVGCDSCSGGGGGGGSSFISGLKGCLAVDSQGKPMSTSVHPSQYIFTDPVTVPGLNLGNGKAIITLIKSFIPDSCRPHVHYRISFLFKIIFILS